MEGSARESGRTCPCSLAVSGGMDKGLEMAGLECVGQVECEPRRLSVLRRHWPDVERWQDVRDCGSATGARPEGRRQSVRERGQGSGGADHPTPRPAPAKPSLICGGFPCQDLSVAGCRAGLAGERSGLWWEFARILGELRPAWVLVENVPGLLSSHEGRDMALLLGSLAELGYGWAYRVLDSQYFGVAQRRRRVFIVGHLGDRPGRLPAEVLFDAASLSGDSPAGGEAREVPARPVGGSSEGSGYRVGLDGGALPLAFNWQSGGDCRQNPSEEGTDALSVGQVPAVMGTLRGNERNNSDPTTEARMHVPGPRPRRLTPRECERLQGFPDDWTRWGVTEAGEEVELADGPRYRMIGDAVTTYTARWLGRRLLEATNG